MSACAQKVLHRTALFSLDLMILDYCLHVPYSVCHNLHIPPLASMQNCTYVYIDSYPMIIHTYTFVLFGGKINVSALHLQQAADVGER